MNGSYSSINFSTRAKSLSAAATAYQAIAARWPQDWAAHFGLGNVRFSTGDYAAAESAYRQAITIKPGEPNIWNNLAYALARQGKSAQAIEAARRAVAAAPDDKTAFERTLAELSGKPAQ